MAFMHLFGTSSAASQLPQGEITIEQSVAETTIILLQRHECLASAETMGAAKRYREHTFDTTRQVIVL